MGVLTFPQEKEEGGRGGSKERKGSQRCRWLWWNIRRQQSRIPSWGRFQIWRVPYGSPMDRISPSLSRPNRKPLEGLPVAPSHPTVWQRMKCVWRSRSLFLGEGGCRAGRGLVQPSLGRRTCSATQPVPPPPAFVRGTEAPLFPRLIMNGQPPSSRQTDRQTDGTNGDCLAWTGTGRRLGRLELLGGHGGDMQCLLCLNSPPGTSGVLCWGPSSCKEQASLLCTLSWE